MTFSRSPTILHLYGGAWTGRSPPAAFLPLQSQGLVVSPANEIDVSHHMASIELNLTACHPNSLADRLNAMPALKTSAAFFTFLRANLTILPTEMTSTVNTPALAPTTVIAPPAGDKSPVATASDLDDIPPLSLGVVTTRTDKVDALRLVTDSIAQQRQTASRSLVFHPVNLAGLAGAIGIAYKLNANKDIGTLMTLVSGITMTYLLGIRYLSSQYLRFAENVDWDWLLQTTDDADAAKTEDTVIGARFGDELIGALVLRLRSSSSAGAQQLGGGDGTIRAWTTKLRYRRRGIGGDLLNEAVRVTRERCGKDAAVHFAQDHANSKRVLANMYNGAFQADERRATQTLDKVLQNWETSKLKR